MISSTVGQSTVFLFICLSPQLTWCQRGKVITLIIKCRMKLIVHSHISMFYFKYVIIIPWELYFPAISVTQNVYIQMRKRLPWKRCEEPKSWNLNLKKKFVFFLTFLTCPQNDIPKVSTGNYICTWLLTHAWMKVNPCECKGPLVTHICYK